MVEELALLQQQLDIALQISAYLCNYMDPTKANISNAKSQLHSYALFSLSKNFIFLCSCSSIPHQNLNHRKHKLEEIMAWRDFSYQKTTGTFFYPFWCTKISFKFLNTKIALPKACPNSVLKGFVGSCNKNF